MRGGKEEEDEEEEQEEDEDEEDEEDTEAYSCLTNTYQEVHSKNLERQLELERRQAEQLRRHEQEKKERERRREAEEEERQAGRRWEEEEEGMRPKKTVGVMAEPPLGVRKAKAETNAFACSLD